MEPSWEWSNAPPIHPDVVAIEKGTFGSSLTTVAIFTFTLYVYIYMCVCVCDQLLSFFFSYKSPDWSTVPLSVCQFKSIILQSVALRPPPPQAVTFRYLKFPARISKTSNFTKLCSTILSRNFHSLSFWIKYTYYDSIPAGLSTLEKEFSAAARIMQSSSEEFSTLVADRVWKCKQTDAAAATTL